MAEISDMELLQDYARRGVEEAFATLVQRHINLVYSVALRHARIPSDAEEITQAVFILLARKAGHLSRDIVLEGWLYQTARFAALSYARGQRRRQFHEQEAYMESTAQENLPDTHTWDQLAPLLDEAMGQLGEKDRDALVLRFFKEKSLREVARALSTNEGAAQRRVLRAVEKLRRIFIKRGASVSVTALTTAISAHSVQAAPVGIVKSVISAAAAQGAATSGSTLVLINGASKLMAYAKLKTAALLGAGFLIAGGTAVVLSQVTPSRQSQTLLLKDFVAQKEAQATAAAEAAGTELLPEYKSLFAAAGQGTWPEIRKLWENLRRRAPQFGGNDGRLMGTQWETIKEVWGAYDNIEGGKVKYPLDFASNIIESIPAGSIYLGGTDPGRFLITALQKSQTNADPFFTLTQNALADTSYLAYLQSFYGGKISIPTEKDSKRMYEDAKARAAGSVTVPEMNGNLTRFIFDKNPDREFYVEENLPIDWMMPYLEPHGLIMKLNRQPLPRLTEGTTQEDHDYWTKKLSPVIGDWLHDNTQVKEVCAFTQKVYLQHNLSGFKGDPEFARNDWAQKWLSKLRISIAGLYVWRAGVPQLGRPAPAQNGLTSESERQRLEEEADFAFRQCVALCPRSPEVAYYYSSFLMHQQRNADALLVGELALRFDPKNPQLQDIVRRIPKAGN
jgi:RNA polymerase sigma factor (sigma-70 family)